jgi:hypothetical protein
VGGCRPPIRQQAVERAAICRRACRNHRRAGCGRLSGRSPTGGAVGAVTARGRGGRVRRAPRRVQVLRRGCSRLQLRVVGGVRLVPRDGKDTAEGWCPCRVDEADAGGCAARPAEADPPADAVRHRGALVGTRRGRHAHHSTVAAASRL